jgi:hypothetical protein
MATLLEAGARASRALRCTLRLAGASRIPPRRSLHERRQRRTCRAAPRHPPLTPPERPVRAAKSGELSKLHRHIAAGAAVSARDEARAAAAKTKADDKAAARARSASVREGALHSALIAVQACTPVAASPATFAGVMPPIATMGRSGCLLRARCVQRRRLSTPTTGEGRSLLRVRKTGPTAT